MATYQPVMASPDAASMQTISNWAAPYITDYLSKGQALASMPYEAYSGPLTAGASDLQQQAFQGLAGLAVPESIGQASAAAQQALKGYQDVRSYSPTQATNQFSAPSAYQASTFDPGFSYSGPSAATQFTNQFAAPGAYEAGNIRTDQWSQQAAQQYMNPYLMEALNPQLNEARRQAEISRMSDAARLTQAGAYGGSRQAIMESELNRNLMRNMSDITGRGYFDAYNTGMQGFMTDQSRALQAQQAAESSRQFGAQQGMSAAQLQAQFGLSAQQAQEAARQFNQGQVLNAAQIRAQFGMDAQKAAELSRQFGADQAMTAAQSKAQFGSEAQRLAEQSRQFGANYGLSSLAGQLSAAQSLANTGLAELGAQRNILADQLAAGQTQRGITSEGITADYNQFREEQALPYKQLEYQKSLMAGLPYATTQQYGTGLDPISAAIQGASGLGSLYQTVTGG